MGAESPKAHVGSAALRSVPFLNRVVKNFKGLNGLHALGLHYLRITKTYGRGVVVMKLEIVLRVSKFLAVFKYLLIRQSCCDSLLIDRHFDLQSFSIMAFFI
jgi:hypothetical protein